MIIDIFLPALLTLLCLAGALWCLWYALIRRTPAEKRISDLGKTHGQYDAWMKGRWGR